MADTLISNIFELTRIVVFAAVLFILVPLIIKKPEKGDLLASIVKGFGVSIFSGILITYTLVILGMYSIVSFLILFFPVVMLIYYWAEGIKLRELNIRERAIGLAVRFFDRIESGKGWWLRTKNKHPAANDRFDGTANRNGFRFSGKTLFICLAVLVFIYILGLRLVEIIPHTFLYYSDSYGHLMITKQFLLGKSMLEKFYPLGYHCIISDIKMVSFTDLVDIIRFFGPIQSTMIMLSIFCFIFMVTKNRYAALFSAAILGLDSLDIWPLVFYRQLVALPQEFGTIFFLPAVYFSLRYIKRRDKRELKYLFIFLCNIFLIHLYVGILLFWVILGVLITGIIFRLWKKDIFKRITVAGALSCLVGAMPFVMWFVIGLVFNLPNRQGEIVPDGRFFYRYVNLQVSVQDYSAFLSDTVNPVKDPLKWHNELSANVIIFSLFFSFLYLVLRCIFRRNFVERHLYLLSLSIGQTFFILFYYGFKYDLISIMYFERIGLVLSLCGAAIAAMLLNEVYVLTRRVLKKTRLKSQIKAVLTYIVYGVILSMIILLPYERTETVVYQHEGVLKAYNKIKKEMELLDWTIVSPVEEMSMVYGYGYHYELWNFLEDFSIRDAQNPSFDLKEKIPSNHIFIIQEKNPLLVWYTIPSTVYHISETERYYRMYHGRTSLQKQLARWIGEYRKNHIAQPNNAQIFYEDQDIIVYHIKNCESIVSSFIDKR